MKTKKWRIFIIKKLLSILLVLGLSITFIACDQEPTTEEQTFDLANDTEVFTVEALSAASLLNYSTVQTLSYVPLAETGEEEEVIEEEINEVDKYLEMMQTYLGDNDSLSINVLDSDRPEYEYLVSFTTVDAYGNQVEYFLYYNETIYEEPVEEAATTPTSNKPEQGWFVFDDEDDDLVVYSLTGLIVYGEIEYEVEGKKVENEDGSLVTRLRAYVDQDNFVKVSYKVDADDGNKKFFYEVKEAGVIVNKSRVHVVNQDEGGIVVHLSFVDETQSSKYSFMQANEEGQTIIHIRYDIRLLADNTRETGMIHIFVTIDPETGEEVYEYKILESNGLGNGSKYRKTVTKKHGQENRPNTSQNNNNA